MGLRDEEVVHEKKPTHMRNAEGRVFIATDALIARGDMEPIFDGETARREIENKKAIERDGPPSHVRAANGRVFIATEALVVRGDMELLYNYKPEDTKSSAKSKDVFTLSKATKQAIHDKGKELFDIEISMDQGLKGMRAEFAELQEFSDLDENDNESEDPGAVDESSDSNVDGESNDEVGYIGDESGK